MIAEDLEKLGEKAKALGASAAVPVKVATIKTGLWTRMKCQFGCPSYGKTLCCPPYTPDAAYMEQFLHEYTWSLLVQYTIPFHPETDGKNWDAMDKKISNGLGHIVVGVERAAFLMDYYKAFALKAGRCRLCDVCNLKHCIHPDLARPAAEACGIDVFALAREHGFPSHVLTAPVHDIKVYGLVLIA